MPEQRLLPPAPRGARSDESGRPDPTGGHCGRCGTHAWTHYSYTCHGCERIIPAVPAAALLVWRHQTLARYAVHTIAADDRLEAECEAAWRDADDELIDARLEAQLDAEAEAYEE